MDHWAIDFGTTNSVVAQERDGSVRALSFFRISRSLPVEQPRLTPSAVHCFEERQGWWIFKRRVLRALIGQQAISRNFDRCSPAFAQSFKPLLHLAPHRAVLKVGDSRSLSAREVSRLFFQGLFREVREQHEGRIEDLTVPTPVGYFEQYRAELRSLTRGLKIRRFRSIDEPIAAALGSGINVARDENLFILDFGGGTLNLAVVKLGPLSAETGRAEVLAKHMIQVGGDNVDHWLVEDLLEEGPVGFPEWQRDVLWEAMYLKERVSATGSGEFRWQNHHRHYTRKDLVDLLTRKGLYDQLRLGLEDIQRQLYERTGINRVDQVILAGGSSLLPEVPAVVDEVFHAAIVRHDPDTVFTGVALGAARFAAGGAVDDFVYHDYALAVMNPTTQQIQYELLIPRRTRYPTPQNFAVRSYGDYEGMADMRLLVCEIGRLGQEPVKWEARSNGTPYWSPASPDERALITELNPADEPIPLRPKGKGTSPRLKMSYFINEDRWLCVNVVDLLTHQPLRVEMPVVRLR